MKDETTYLHAVCISVHRTIIVWQRTACAGPVMRKTQNNKWDFTVWHYYYHISDQDNYSPHQFSWLLHSIVLVVLGLRNRTASGLYRLKYILRSRIRSNATCVCCSHCAYSGDILLYAVIMSRTCAECVSNFPLSWCLRFKMSRQTIVTTVLYTTSKADSHYGAGRGQDSGQVAVSSRTGARFGIYIHVRQLGCGSVYFGSILWRNWENEMWNHDIFVLRCEEGEFHTILQNCANNPRNASSIPRGN